MENWGIAEAVENLKGIFWCDGASFNAGSATVVLGLCGSA